MPTEPPSSWRDATWLFHIVSAAKACLDHVDGLTSEQFATDRLRQSAVARELTIIGEATKRLSPELRESLPHIPWTSIAVLRDVIVHDYFRIDYERVWQVTRDELTPLISASEPLIPPLDDVSDEH